MGKLVSNFCMFSSTSKVTSSSSSSSSGCSSSTTTPLPPRPAISSCSSNWFGVTNSSVSVVWEKVVSCKLLLATSVVSLCLYDLLKFEFRINVLLESDCCSRNKFAVDASFLDLQLLSLNGSSLSLDCFLFILLKGVGVGVDACKCDCCEGGGGG